jgi:hypothetical protein
MFASAIPSPDGAFDVLVMLGVSFGDRRNPTSAASRRYGRAERGQLLGGAGSRVYVVGEPRS